MYCFFCSDGRAGRTAEDREEADQQAVAISDCYRNYSSGPQSGGHSGNEHDCINVLREQYLYGCNLTTFNKLLGFLCRGYTQSILSHQLKE